MNLLQGKIQCIECENTNLIKDYKRQEIYCSKCGLVLVNNDIPQINQAVTLNQKNQDKEINKKTEKIQYMTMKNFFYNFF